MGLIYAAYAACCLATLLRVSPAWWRWLNAAGAGVGRALAWACSGGPGWKLASVQIERKRQEDAMDALQARQAAWRARYRSRPPADYDDSPSRPRWCEACGRARFRCPRALALDTTGRSAVGCSGARY